MNRLALSLFCVFLVAGVAGDPVAASESHIRDAIGRIDEDSMMATVERLVAFDTRFMGSDSSRAAVEWLEGRLLGMGYEVNRDTFLVDVNRSVLGQRFVLSGLEQVNLSASVEGVLNPGTKVVLGAHYDSISLDRAPDEQDVAPGADDNATGVAALLEIARVMRSLQSGMTIEFVLFGAEELGLIGSEADAESALDDGEQIEMMIGLDVLGTRSGVFPDAFTIDTSSPNASLAERLADAAETYTSVFSRDGSSNSRIMVSSRGCACSDHQSFLDHGFPAVGVFQFFTNASPHINMSTDTIENVDIFYAAEIARAVFAGALEIAGFPARTPDFDGDGVVAFGDFLMFAEVFGQDVAGASDEPFDLDVDGTIGFSDFLLFAGSFGQQIG